MKTTFTEIQQRAEKWITEYFDNEKEKIWDALQAATVDKNVTEVSYLSFRLSKIEEDKEEVVYNIYNADGITSVINAVLGFNDDILDLEGDFFEEIFGVKIKFDPF